MENLESLRGLPTSLIEDARSYILKSDKAHNESHIKDVIRDAWALSSHLDEEDRKVVMLSALLHDTGCSVKGERATHEIHSERIANKLMDKHGIDVDRDKLSQCILEHRSSFKGVRSGPLSDIMAAADKGRPDAGKMYRRAYAYSRDMHGASHEDAIAHAREHLREKFGKGGTAQITKNRLMMQMYKKDSLSAYDTIMNSTYDQVAEFI